MKMALIINPISGRKKAPRVIAMAERLAVSEGIDLEIHTITAPRHGTELAMQAVANGVRRVICVGGDGTLNAVADGLVGTDVALGIVPAGSGNGYARSIGIPTKPVAALLTAMTGEATRMDVGYVNDHLFIGTAGVGFDARVAWKFDRSPRRGMLTYMRIILGEIFTAKPMAVRMDVNGIAIDTTVLMLVVCNTREFGNGAIISPSSLPDDGIAEIRMIAKPAFLPLLKAFYDVYSGGADASPYVRNINCTEATIEQAGSLAHVDGEPIVIGERVTFRLEQGKLLVVR